ncbi:MAG TPA: prepilin-type N-terminal cleavage/methylation domain-containing protein [Candidatus Angelobacter sp.]|nr:prepilin-type N-terminal cleavage/methylation domain-containing protein [Candidatus Angelobacter sp.]
MTLTSRAPAKQRGFTLIEMIIVVTIIAILASIAVPVYGVHLRHAHEAVLKEDLYTLRNAIDQFTQDKNKAPQDLNDLVSAGYIRAIPKDPFTNSNTSWQTVQEDVMTAIDQTQPGITDVHSGSDQTSSDGTAYSSW